MFLFKSNQLHGYRLRSISIASALLLAVVGMLAIPLPYSAIAEGVVWVDQQAWVRNKSEGFVTAVNVRNHSEVDTGSAIATLSNDEIETQLERLDLFLQELDTQYEAVKFRDRVQASIIQQQIEATHSQKQKLETRQKNLIVRSEFPGRFVRLDAADLEGRYLPKGSLIGFIADGKESTVRVVVDQDDIDLVRSELVEVSLRFAENLTQIVPGKIIREIPAATQSLPSLALSSQGGGDILLSPEAGANTGASALKPYFQLDIQALGEVPRNTYGGRVIVRFSFARTPLASQLYRPIKQTFLSKFG